MTTLHEQIERLREMEKHGEKATWKYTPGDECDDWTICDHEGTYIKQEDSGVPISDKIGELICESRNMLPKLLDELEVLAKACEEIGKPVALDDSILNRPLENMQTANEALAQSQRIMETKEK